MPPAQKLISDHSFKVSVSGLDIGTFNECDGLSMEFDVFEWAEGGNNEFVHHLPGRQRYPYLRLSAGLTENKAIQEWFEKTRDKAELKEVTIELSAQDGKSKRSWKFADAFPIRWTGPRAAAGAGGMAVETLEIAHSGLKIA
jgi:phage tail-like protein